MHKKKFEKIEKQKLRDVKEITVKLDIVMTVNAQYKVM